MQSVIDADILFIDGEEPADYLNRIHQQYRDFVLAWETSKHEPSRMVALFIKVTSSYLRCKGGVHNVDFWLLEEESCEWMGAWKLLGKHTYLRLQCEAIEALCREEGISAYTREVMRINRLIILSETENGVSYDFVNELYNLWLKTPPTTPFIETAIERSRHCIMQRTCSKEIFNVRTKKAKASGKSEYIDRLTIEFILTRWALPRFLVLKILFKSDIKGFVWSETKLHQFTKSHHLIVPLDSRLLLHHSNVEMDNVLPRNMHFETIVSWRQRMIAVGTPHLLHQIVQI